MRVSRRGGTVNWATSFSKTVPDAGPMGTDEFKNLCARLLIEDSFTAAELFGLSWRTCQRYWYGKLSVTPPLARLLRLAAGLKMTHAQLRRLARPKTPARL